MRALRRAHAEKAAARKVRTGIEIRQSPEFFPLGSKVEDAGKLLLKEGFKLVSASSLDTGQAESSGVHASQLHHYKRFTHVHPLGAFLWEVRLYADGNGTICAFRARPYYDGV
jgi:hypothetical protein